jgi:hypothetical protein
VAPKSLPHSIQMPPGLSALFNGGGKGTEIPQEKPAPSAAATDGIGFPAPVIDAPVDPAPAPEKPVTLAALAAGSPSPGKDEEAKKRPAKPQPLSRHVRVTQPVDEGRPKGRHTLVIDEDVFEELALLAWAENLSASAIAREAFGNYLKMRAKAIEQARVLREGFVARKEAS